MKDRRQDQDQEERESLHIRVSIRTQSEDVYSSCTELGPDPYQESPWERGGCGPERVGFESGGGKRFEFRVQNHFGAQYRGRT